MTRTAIWGTCICLATICLASSGCEGLGTMDSPDEGELRSKADTTPPQEWEGTCIIYCLKAAFGHDTPAYPDNRLSGHTGTSFSGTCETEILPSEYHRTNLGGLHLWNRGWVFNTSEADCARHAGGTRLGTSLGPIDAEIVTITNDPFLYTFLRGRYANRSCTHSTCSLENDAANCSSSTGDSIEAPDCAADPDGCQRPGQSGSGCFFCTTDGWVSNGRSCTGTSSGSPSTTSATNAPSPSNAACAVCPAATAVPSCQIGPAATLDYANFRPGPSTTCGPTVRVNRGTTYAGKGLRQVNGVYWWVVDYNGSCLWVRGDVANAPGSCSTLPSI